MSNQLAEIQSKINELQQERVDLLASMLEEAQAALESGSLVLSAPTKPAAKKRRRSKAVRKAAPKTGARSASRKRARRGRANAEERLETLVTAVKAAGKAGISANQLSGDTGIPYSAIRKIIAESGRFVQKGTKRASRLFLK